MEMTQNEANAWCAGLMIADGTINIRLNNHSGKTYHRAGMALRMNDSKTVGLFAKIAEITFRVYFDKKAGYKMYSAETQRSDDFIRLAPLWLPFMTGPKCGRLELALMLAEDIRRWKAKYQGQGGLPKEVLKHREALYRAYKKTY